MESGEDVRNQSVHEKRPKKKKKLKKKVADEVGHMLSGGGTGETQLDCSVNEELEKNDPVGAPKRPRKRQRSLVGDFADEVHSDQDLCGEAEPAPPKRKKKKMRPAAHDEGACTEPDLPSAAIEERFSEEEQRHAEDEDASASSKAKKKVKKKRRTDVSADPEEGSSETVSCAEHETGASSSERKKKQKKRTQSPEDSTRLTSGGEVEIDAGGQARQGEVQDSSAVSPPKNDKKVKGKRPRNVETEDNAGSGDDEQRSGLDQSTPRQKSSRYRARRRRSQPNPLQAELSQEALHLPRAWKGVQNQKKSFDDAGVPMRTGWWSVEENQLLKANVEEFLAEHGGVPASEIIFNWSPSARSGFYRAASKGLRRPLFSTYRRLRRLYDPKNHGGAWSADDCMRLLELYKKHGAKWGLIGEELGRTAQNVFDKHRHLCLMPAVDAAGNDYESGRRSHRQWSTEEEKKLVAYVHELKGVPESDVITSEVPWEAVAVYMKTRSPAQCRTKFMLTTAGFAQIPEARWTPADSVHLLDMLYSSSTLDEGEIPWSDLQARQWPWAPVPFLKLRWVKLRSKVPNSRHLTLEECLDYLNDHCRERLLTKVARSS